MEVNGFRKNVEALPNNVGSVTISTATPLEHFEIGITINTVLSHKRGIGTNGRTFRNSCRSSIIHGDQVDYVNAPATSTPLGDLIEASIITLSALFARERNTLLIHFLLGATGHLLGAAGAVQAIFAVLAMHHGLLH